MRGQEVDLVCMIFSPPYSFLWSFVHIQYSYIFAQNIYIFPLNFSQLLFYQVYKSNQIGILQSSVILFSELIVQCIELCQSMLCPCSSLQIEREGLWIDQVPVMLLGFHLTQYLSSLLHFILHGGWSRRVGEATTSSFRLQSFLSNSERDFFPKFMWKSTKRCLIGPILHIFTPMARGSQEAVMEGFTKAS